MLAAEFGEAVAGGIEKVVVGVLDDAVEIEGDDAEGFVDGGDLALVFGLAALFLP